MNPKSLAASRLTCRLNWPRTVACLSLVWLSILTVNCVLAAQPNKDQATESVPSKSARPNSVDQKPIASTRVKKTRNAIGIDEATEREALDLAASHMPKLSPLLAKLREGHPRSYRKAIMDLSRSVRRLQSAQKRGPEHYELELRLIKATNEVNLLTAKLKVRDHRDDRQALKVAIADLLDAQLHRAKLDVAVHQKRLQSVSEQLRLAEQRLQEKQRSFDTQLETTFNKSLRKAGRDEVLSE